MKQLTLVLALLTLVSCSTVAKRRCKNIDWNHVGRVDAEMNRADEFKQEHRDSCGKQFDEKAWKLGTEEGRLFHCTADGAYYAGKNGDSFPAHCSAEERVKLQPAFKEGELYRREAGRLAQLRQELNQAKEAEAKKASQKSSFTQDLGRYLFPTEKASVALEAREQEMQKSVDAIDVKYAAPPSVHSSLNDDLQNAAGAGLGTVMGFGIGHAVQSRYTQRGWWFTVGEIGVWFVPGAGALVGFLGLKVWESWDVWNYRYQESLGYK